MNLSFSTRGWPDLSWQEMIDTALDMGFGGNVYILPSDNRTDCVRFLRDISKILHTHQPACRAACRVNNTFWAAGNRAFLCRNVPRPAYHRTGIHDSDSHRNT